MADKLNLHSSRSRPHTGTLLDLLIENATQAARELYRRVMANKRTEVMLALSERDGAYYLQLSAGPLPSEEAAFFLLADLAEKKDATLKEFRVYGSQIKDETDAPGS